MYYWGSAVHTKDRAERRKHTQHSLVLRDLQRSSVSGPCSKQGQLTVRAPCSGLRPIQFWNRDFKTSKGSLFHCLTTVLMEKLFPCILPWFPSRQLVSILISLLFISEKSPALREHPDSWRAWEYTCKRIPAEQSPSTCTVLWLGKCCLLKGFC